MNTNNDKVQRIVLENGSSYYVYIPENVNKDSNFFVYSFGAGMSQFDYKAALKKMNTVGSNQIVILADGDDSTFWTNKDDWAQEALDVVDQLKKQYNITSNNVTSGCFSAGGYQGINTTIQHLKRNQGKKLEPQAAVLLDAYGFNRGETYYRPISDESLQLLKENQTVLFAFQPPGKFPTEYQRYIDEGLNLVRINCTRSDHMTINNDFFANNFLEAIHDGNVKFPTDSYEFSRFNKDTNSWETIDMNNIDSYDKLLNLFNINTENVQQEETSTEDFSDIKLKFTNLKNLEDIVIKSDDVSLQNALNSIRHSVKSSSCVQEGLTSISSTSTTKVPKEIPDVIANYFKMTATLLELVTNQTDTFVSIYNSINNVDQNLAIETNNIEKVQEQIEQQTEIETKKQTETQTEKTKQQTEIETKKQIETQTEKTKQQTEIETKKQTETQTEKPKQQTEIETKKQTETQTQQIKKEEPYKEPMRQHTPTYQSSGGAPVQEEIYQSAPQTEEVDTTVMPNREFEFEKFNNLTTTPGKVVYGYKDNCRIVVHNEGNNLLGLEHYYRISEDEDIDVIFNKLKKKYNPNIIDKIEIEGNCIRVNFNKKVLSRFKYNDIKQKYININII